MNVEQIKRKAADQGLSIAALERKADLGNGIVRKWQSGFCKPTLTSIAAICKVLGCTVDDLLKEEE